MPKTDHDRRTLLASLDLDPDAPALDQSIRRPIAKQPTVVAWAPAGVDPHSMPLDDIEFTPAMVEHFPDLSAKSRKAASSYLFDQYKGARGSDRNKLLHRLIGSFLANEHERRNPGGGYVQDKVRLANTLAQHDVKAEDLDEFLAWKAQQG